MSTKESVKKDDSLFNKPMVNEADVKAAINNDDLASGVEEEVEELLDLEGMIGTEVESYKKFKPRAEFNELCLGNLIDVEVKMVSIPSVKADGLPSDYEYAGYTIPKLVLSFKQEPTTDDPADRRYVEYLSPIAHRKNDGTEVEKKTIIEFYQTEFKFLRHIANAFVGLANYNAVKIPGVNINTGILQKRIDSITQYYNAWAELFKGKDSKGFSNVRIWIKLIASPEGNRLILPRYVAEGFIERWIQGRKPSIELRVSETTTLTRKAKGEKSNSKTSSKTTEGPAASNTPGYSSEVDDILKNYGVNS